MESIEIHVKVLCCKASNSVMSAPMSLCKHLSISGGNTADTWSPTKPKSEDFRVSLRADLHSSTYIVHSEASGP